MRPFAKASDDFREVRHGTISCAAKVARGRGRYQTLVLEHLKLAHYMTSVSNTYAIACADDEAVVLMAEY